MDKNQGSKQGGGEQFADQNATPQDTDKRHFCVLSQGQVYTNQPANLKAKALHEQAKRWKDANAGIWSEWLSEVSQAVSARRSWSIAWLVDDTRRYRQVDSAGSDFKVNNTLKAALARMLCAEVEGAADRTRLKESIFEQAERERNNPDIGEQDSLFAEETGE